MMNWLVGSWHWPAACLFCACLLLLLTPVWLAVGGLALTLVYVQLPVYMLHQWEEHTRDRFRKYVNDLIGGGREALTPEATFWINALGVWGLDLLTLYLASFADLSFGLIAVYLPLVNALGHIVPAVALSRYNPGLWTAVGLFVPFSGWGLIEIGTAAAARWPAHVLAAVVAVGVHAGIVVHVVLRLHRLPRDGSTGD
jgi:hypothetical protein